MDLSFADPAAEQGYRREQARNARGLQRSMEVLRVLCWVIAAYKAWEVGQAAAASGLAAASLSSALLVVLCSYQERIPLRAVYIAVVATNLSQCMVGLKTYDCIYPASSADELAGPSPAICTKALLLLAMGNGIMWLVYYAKFSPLPFRWQWPQLGAVAGMLLCHTDTVCANANMQLGYAQVHGLAQLLLPMLVPPAAVNYLAEPPPALGTPAQQVCQVYQPVALLLGLAALALNLYDTEKQQRERHLEGQRQRGQLVPQRGQMESGAQACAAAGGGARALLSPASLIHLGLPVAACTYAFASTYCWPK